jgi:hypothetical protein
VIYTPHFILGTIVLELLCWLVNRHAVRARADQVQPEFRFVQWGYLDELYYSKRVSIRFFAVKLPSWQWMHSDYGRRYGWHQLEIVWTSERGWFTFWRECPHMTHLD